MEDVYESQELVRICEFENPQVTPEFADGSAIYMLPIYARKPVEKSDTDEE